MTTHTTAPEESSRGLHVASKRRWFVFGCIVALNFAVWLDEAKVTQLASFWSDSLHLTPSQTASVLSAYLLGYAPMLAIEALSPTASGPSACSWPAGSA
jgi:hypothetical protein